MHEIENCATITLTSESEWDPYDTKYQKSELNANYSVMANLPKHHDLTDNIFMRISTISQLQTSKKDNFIESQQLAQDWATTTNMAKSTLKATTQDFIRGAIHPIGRRFCTKNLMLRYNRLSCKMYSDTFFSGNPSILGNKCGQLFVTDFGYLKFVPMKTKSEAGIALQEMIQEVRILTQIHIDGAKELTSAKWKEICCESNILCHKQQRIAHSRIEPKLKFVNSSGASGD